MTRVPRTPSDWWPLFWAEGEPVNCTGVAAKWCPNCGECRCDQLRHCPLHGVYSDHRTDDDLAEQSKLSYTELTRVRRDLGFDPF